MEKKKKKSILTQLLLNILKKKSCFKGFFFFFGEKYNLAPPTTSDSPDGTPNYQSLDSGPSNYQTLAFWPPPLVCTVILDEKHYMCTTRDSKGQKSQKYP
jgi:hypothetical protein